MNDKNNVNPDHEFNTKRTTNFTKSSNSSTAPSPETIKNMTTSNNKED